jgi:signal transduction histidine kinase
MKADRPRSLRSQIVVVSTVTTLILLSIAAAVAVWLIRLATDRALADAVRTRLLAVRTEVSASGQLAPRPGVSAQATFVQVLDAQGRVVSASPSLAGLAPLVPLGEARRTGHVRQVSPPGPDVDLAVVGTPLLVNGQPGALLVGLDSQGFLDARNQVWVVVLIGVPLAVALSAGLTWVLTGRTLRSVARLAEEADAISVGESDRVLTIETRDAEVQRLVMALNRMLGRLDRRYAENLAASAGTTHRLRTPLATLRADAELALADPDPDAARSALGRVIEDADRLARLIDRLLASAHSAEHSRRLDELHPTVTGEWERQAALLGRGLHVDISGQAAVDVETLRASVDPLVENALQHGSGTAPVVVSITQEDDVVVVRVENFGGGVPAELLETLFEPWTGTGRSGLGLWLAREAARSTGGDLVCTAPGPPITVFEVRLPLDAPALLPQRTSPATPLMSADGGLGSQHE